MIQEKCIAKKKEIAQNRKTGASNPEKKPLTEGNLDIKTNQVRYKQPKEKHLL